MKERFLAAFKEALELEDEQINMNNVISDFDTWDSLSRLSLIVELDENFDVTIETEEFDKLETVEDLYKLVQIEIEAVNG